MCSAMLVKRNTANGSDVNFVSAKMAKHSAPRNGKAINEYKSALPTGGTECWCEAKTSFQAVKAPINIPTTARLQIESQNERNTTIKRLASDFKYATVATVTTLKTMPGIT